MEIRLRPGGWGDARTEEVETVLNAVALVMLEHFPGRRLDPIVVTHTSSNPVTLFRRDANNQYQMFLTADGRQWARYAYEFAHELSHILTDFQHIDPAVASYNQWFAEALCEVASLYALKRLAFEWEVAPPYPHWGAYAPQFQRYAERMLTEEHRRLPADTTLARWFEKNQSRLRASPYRRDYNEVVANLLLPLFEENPEIWEAIAFLNVHDDGGSFQGYLQSWYDNAPDDYRDIIRYVMAWFGVLRDTPESLIASPPPAAPNQHGIDPDPRDASRSGVAGSTSP